MRNKAKKATKLSGLSKYASMLGKKSWEKQQEMGHDNEYYRQMSLKRWNKAKSERGNEAKITPSHTEKAQP